MEPTTGTHDDITHDDQHQPGYGRLGERGIARTARHLELRPEQVEALRDRFAALRRDAHDALREILDDDQWARFQEHRGRRQRRRRGPGALRHGGRGHGGRRRGRGRSETFRA